MLPMSIAVPVAVTMIRKFYPGRVREWATKASFGLALLASAARGQDATPEQVIGKQIENIKATFAKADATALSNLFIPQGEMINEEGTVYRGRDELKALFTDFFARFPGAKIDIAAESIRSVGSNLIIEEGSRKITTANGESRADLRYAAVWSKLDGQWLIASVREIADDAPATPHALLDSLSWMIGQWINEGDDAAVKITYQWSEDGNYILGDYEVITGGTRTSRSAQRIGWDPVAQRIRSWIFDADGGFSEGSWTPTADGWMISSSAVLPTGQTASATLNIVPTDANRFTIKGTHRLIGGVLDDDFEVIVTKRPAPGSEAKGETNEKK
jgi:uncharacterized protein (TIGR02246 family)